jgi:hypothetical protein
MTNYTGYPDGERQEFLVKESEYNWVVNAKLFSLLNSIWQYIVTAFTRGQEPKVWQRSDRSGQTWWYAYDPVTERSACRDSEAEILIWLEERYYQRDCQ